MDDTQVVGGVARQINVAEFTEVTMRAVARALEDQKLIQNPVLIYGIIALPQTMLAPVPAPNIETRVSELHAIGAGGPS